MPAVGSDHWNTPIRICESLNEFARGGRVGLDPCSNARSQVHAEIEWFGPPEGKSGLVLPWWPLVLRKWLVYVNPPYSAKPIWMRKCAEEAARGCEIIALIPADTDTTYWHEYCWPAPRKCFLKGRLVFDGVKSDPESARFPSALIYWGHRPVTFGKVFHRLGRICV